MKTLKVISKTVYKCLVLSDQVIKMNLDLVSKASTVKLKCLSCPENIQTLTKMEWKSKMETAKSAKLKFLAQSSNQILPNPYSTKSTTLKNKLPSCKVWNKEKTNTNKKEDKKPSWYNRSKRKLKKIKLRKWSKRK